ncbi:MAG: ABC transporter permease [Anaerolineae bacterium]
MTALNPELQDLKQEEATTKRKTPFMETVDNLRRSTSAKIGFFIIVFHVLLALLSPYITGAMRQDPFTREAGRNQESSISHYSSCALSVFGIGAHDCVRPEKYTSGMQHWFGGDSQGRDVFARTLLGGRTLLTVTIFGTTMAMLWGSFVGIMLGFLGGRADEIMMRLVDAFLAIPWLLFLLLIVGIVGTDPWIQMLTLGFFYGIPVIRVARAATQDYVTREFVLAARARGEKKITVMLRELLPNVLDVLLVEGAMRWSWMLLAFISLSFLGFGVPPSNARTDWGLMISQSRSILQLQPWATFGPILFLSSLIVGINLFADALAKALGLDRSQGAPV